MTCPTCGFWHEVYKKFTFCASVVHGTQDQVLPVYNALVSTYTVRTACVLGTRTGAGEERSYVTHDDGGRLDTAVARAGLGADAAHAVAVVLEDVVDAAADAVDLRGDVGAVPAGVVVLVLCQLAFVFRSL